MNMCLHTRINETIVDGPIGLIQVERRCLECSQYESHFMKQKDSKEAFFTILNRKLSPLDVQAVAMGWRDRVKIKSVDLRKHKNMYT